MSKSLLTVLVAMLPTLCLAQWSYETEQDKMTSKVKKTAVIKSDNSMDLDFPYKGKNHGWIQVRQHPQWGLDVIFLIDKGQIICNSYQGCPIQVRFDEGKVQTFEGTKPADHSSTAVFLNNPKRFIQSASKAKRILIQANIYKSGSQVLEFVAPQPLSWNTKK